MTLRIGVIDIFFVRLDTYFENLSISSALSERKIWPCLRRRQLPSHHPGKKKLRVLERAGEAASPQFPINENERSCTSWITGVGVRGKQELG